ncbi:phage tail protein [Dysgonomonas sp. 520]|uniref:phage tail protein n=1 Tax=Dysgonomonas sp. 520 TaxID=2302931 RepID=UPI0013D871AE|nr:tail fiber protein [Dysgonomonas sp. 520]NDW10797.1 phage tail protein [Dysgonomonas sp. 520]
MLVICIVAISHFATAQDQYLGEIRMFAGNFPPRGWALCNGQFLSISQNQALFALLGTTYGGNGFTTFALPNLQGRVPIHAGNGHELGQTGGEANHTISVNELPAHNHVATATQYASKSDGTSSNPNGQYPAVSETNAYSATADTKMATTTLSTSQTGSGTPVNNMQPYTVVNYIIAIQGVFPSRN